MAMPAPRQVPVAPAPAGYPAPSYPPAYPVPAVAAPRASQPRVQAASPSAPMSAPRPMPVAPSMDPFAPQPARPSAPMARRSVPPAPAPAPPVRQEIPSSVVGPDLVVRKGAGMPAPRAAEPDDSAVATSEAQVQPTVQGAMPVVVRKVPRPLEEEHDLPQTEAWTPKRDVEPPPKARPAGGPQTPPLFDDSYKLFRADELDQPQPPQLPQAQPPQQPAPPDRSMDLIWWSLAIAGALVLVALLITFR